MSQTQTQSNSEMRGPFFWLGLKLKVIWNCADAIELRVKQIREGEKLDDTDVEDIITWCGMIRLKVQEIRDILKEMERER